MREILEDADAHRTDGYGRAQKAMERPLPKRFYKLASVGETEGGFTVLLDGRATRTPGKVPVHVPSPALAELMAAEWNGQGEAINAQTMPVVRLINSAVEGGTDALPGLRGEISKYAGTDLLLYRAEMPQDLVLAQEQHWDAVLVALARHFGVVFMPTQGISFRAQPAKTLAALERSLAENGLFTAAAKALITGLTGSGLLAVALGENLIEPEAAWAAAHVDEDYNMRLWGVDSEALKRLNKRRIDFDAAVTVLRLAGGH